MIYAAPAIGAYRMPLRLRYVAIRFAIWSDRRADPAYLRGIPSWVWQSALCHRGQRRPVAAT